MGDRGPNACYEGVERKAAAGLLSGSTPLGFYRCFANLLSTPDTLNGSRLQATLRPLNISLGSISVTEAAQFARRISRRLDELEAGGPCSSGPDL